VQLLKPFRARAPRPPAADCKGSAHMKSEIRNWERNAGFPTGTPTEMSALRNAGFPTGTPTEMSALRNAGFPTDPPTGMSALRNAGFPTGDWPTGMSALRRRFSVKRRESSTFNSHFSPAPGRSRVPSRLPRRNQRQRFQSWHALETVRHFRTRADAIRELRPLPGSTQSPFGSGR